MIKNKNHHRIRKEIELFTYDLIASPGFVGAKIPNMIFNESNKKFNDLIDRMLLKERNKPK